MVTFPELLQPSWYSAAGRLAYRLSRSKFIGNTPVNQSVTAKVAAYAVRFFVAVPLLIAATALDVSRNLLLLSISPLVIPIFLLIDKKFSFCFYFYRAVFIDILASTALPLVAIGFALKGQIMPSNRIDNFVLCNRFSVLKPDSMLIDAVIEKKDHYTLRRLLKKFPATQFQAILHEFGTEAVLSAHPFDPQSGRFEDSRITSEDFSHYLRRIGPIIKTSTLSLPEQFLAKSSFKLLLTLIEFGYEVNVPQLIAFKLMVTEMIERSGTTFASNEVHAVSFLKSYNHFSSQTFCRDTYSIRNREQGEESCNHNPYFLGLRLASGHASAFERLEGVDVDIRFYTDIPLTLLQEVERHNTKECVKKIYRLYLQSLNGINQSLDAERGVKGIIIHYLTGSDCPENSNEPIWGAAVPDDVIA